MSTKEKRLYVCARLTPDEHAQIRAVAEMESDSASGVLKKALKRLSNTRGKPALRDSSLFLNKGGAHLSCSNSKKTVTFVKS